MTERRRNTLGTAALILGFAVLYMIILLSAVHLVGTDGKLYYSEQQKAGVQPSSGISDDALRQLDTRLADYLRGDAAALNEYGDQPGLEAPVVAVEVFGAPQPAFNARELSHLFDCYNLFELLRKVRKRLIPWAVLLIVGGAYLLKNRRRVWLCAWLSPLVLLVPLAGFAAWAAFDFDAAFTLFHRVLFRNDLWLLDPATDLLIRICPESMFMHMGVRIGVYSLIAILAASAAATILTFTGPKGKGEKNAWKTTTRRGPAPRQITFGNRGGR